MQPQIKLTNKLTYKLRLTPQVRLAIKLLQMPLIGLKEFMERQIEENPLLDVEHVDSFSRSKEKFKKYANHDEEKRNYKESLITKPITLSEHLLRQLQLFTNSDRERKIGELIIGDIDENGYLGSSIEDIAESAKTYTSKVEKVLSLIQTFDPIGVGARNLRECLLIQAKAKGEENSLAGQIIDKYLSNLEKRQYDYIAKKLKLPVERVEEAIKEIANLEPKPGRSFNEERPIHLIPDAMLRKTKQKYEVIFNDGELPQITINEKYKRMLKQKNTPQNAKEYLRERLKAARSLINAIAKRRETIKKIIEEIVYVQKGFLDNGASDFKPMTLEQIAKKIGKHKSTISRAVTNKYLHTPWGIFELRYFLNSGIKQGNGKLLSSKAIKSKIKDLIECERKEKPLSDQKITERLKQEGTTVSRRTITKYRRQLKILSSRSRPRKFT